MTGVARAGDSGMVHCSGYVIASGSSDVLVNGRPAARVGDSSTVHLRPVGKKCFPHVALITSGSTSVFANGRPLARIGSSLAGCTVIISGSPNVFVGR
jgi:uncharacterized Zn-binding protein involved in type VI secretion